MPPAPDESELREFLAALGDRYDDITPLLGGGMAELFVAQERRLARTVVIKRAARRLADVDARERFHREIELLATLQHPNIVPLLRADEINGTPYFVMPFVQGESLRERLERGPLSVREAIAILDDVAQALAAAHSVGIVHRDIKPANILLTAGAAVVADFGVAKAVARSPMGRPIALRTPTDPTLEGLSVGTPRYMAPEQVAADPSADHRVDIYALGIVAYEMLVGAPPFTAQSPAKLARAHLAEAPAPLNSRRADVPAPLAALVHKCLEKDPDARPRTATDVLNALRSSSLRQALQNDEAGGTGDTSGTSRRSRVGTALTELRHATRALARTPTLFAACLFCLALGIGSTAAVFSVVDRALLKPLPFDEPERLVSVFRTVTGGSNLNPHSAPNILALREDPTLNHLEAVALTSHLVELGDRAVQAASGRITGTAFATLGVRPLLGRVFVESDDIVGAPAVVLLSHEFWRERLGGSPGVIGTSLRIDGTVHDIIGVLPPGFRIPNGGQMIAREIWLPMRFTDTERAQPTSNYLRAFARLAPGRSLAEAQAAMDARFAALTEQNADLRGNFVVVRSMAGESRNDVRTPLLLMLAAALAVLAIAVINVSSLLLARGIRRQPELAVRTALGATRWEVMRPVFAESVVIALLGSLGGLALATLAVRTIGWLAAQRIPQLEGASIDWRAVLAAFALALFASTLGAVAPALRAVRVEPADALRGGRGSAQRGQHRTLATLVMVEGALAMALLIAAGLVFKGFLTLSRHDPGFDPNRLLTMHVRVSPSDYADGRPVISFLEPALEAVRGVPGVTAVGAISQLPYAEWGWNSWVRYDGMPDVPMTERPLVESRNVTSGFFGATGQRLLSGRLLDARDDAVATGPRKIVVNQALVKRDFPNRDPIGQRLYLGDQGDEIVGVVSDIRNFGPFTAPRPEAYWTFAQRNPSAAGMWVVVRTASDDPRAVAGAVEQAIRSVNLRAAVSRVRPMPEVIDESLGEPRFLFALFGTLALVALLLALAGLFGMLSYAVEQERRELGVRSALGAPPTALTRAILRRGGALVGASVVMGLVLAFYVTRVMESVLYGVAPRDAGVWGAAIGAMVLAGVAAMIGPARRAGHTPPMVAMRGD